MKKRAADIIINELIESGVTDCFVVVGGGAMHLDNALALRDDISKTYCHHEQACAMAAEGYAKAGGKLAVVCVTSGPGAINTFNGVEGAWADSVPMLVLAGHPRQETTVPPTGLNLRCRGVQEFDSVTAVKGMTKYASLVTDPLSVRREVKKAIDIAMQGRRGPVWLSVPLDVQGAFVEEESLYGYEGITPLEYTLEDGIFDRLNEMIAQAKRPCILTGSGLRTGDAVNAFRDWAEKMNIPIIGGALQADISWDTEPLYYGISGSCGNRKANFILQNADLILALGNSMSTKQTGFNQEEFAVHARLVMVDAEPDEMKKPGLMPELAIYADAAAFLEQASRKLLPWKTNKEWMEYCDGLDSILADADVRKKQEQKDRVSSDLFWDELRQRMAEDAVIALGNSSCINAMLRKGIKEKDQRVIVNYNSGSMGDDLPEAVGIATALKKEVICVTGDGSIMMNLQELQTIVHYGLPVKVVIFSNNGYGAIRETNKSFFDGLYAGCDSESGISFPSFEKVGAAFGIPYFNCENCGMIEEGIEWLLHAEGAAVLEVQQLFNDPVLPKVTSKMREDGSFYTPPLHDMYPFISDELLQKLMLEG